ncbi:unnamed protein product [Parnassius mnemosyne]|uniref:Uncharacterized protein n=1 Tax=Parnassius mnemosyne TaxID=213953 RepID=A0AAV1KJG4_9NEOP
MGKRKSSDNPDKIRKKIKKLEKKLRKKENFEGPKENTPPLVDLSVPNVTIAESLEENTIEEIQMEGQTNASDNDDIPEELLLALGPEGEESKEVGEPINMQLATRWTKIMMEGLGKEPRDKILNKFLTPSNFKAVIAPQMNPEIKASLSEILIKRDKRLVNRQNMTGKIMTGIGLVLTNIIKGNINTRDIVEQLSDTAKIAAEIFYEDSAARRYFALSGATIVLKEALKNAKTDELLFGKDCPENIKTAQTVQRTGAQIKAVEKKKTVPKKGNWKSPLQVQHLNRSGQNYRVQPNKQKYRPSQPLRRRTQHTGAPPAQTRRNYRH